MKTVDKLKKNWWWRDCDFSGHIQHLANNSIPGITMGPTWKEGYHWTAWHWELLRRHKEAPALPTFVSLEWCQISDLGAIFGKSETFTIEKTMGDGGAIQPEPGYSDPSIWPLHLGDGPLISNFKKFLNEQREKHGVKNGKSKYSRSSEVSKGPHQDAAWRKVELLDLADIRGKTYIAHNKEFDQRRFEEAKPAMRESWELFKAAQPLPSFPAVIRHFYKVT